MTPEQEAEFKKIDAEVVALREQAQIIVKKIEDLKAMRRALKAKLLGAPAPK